MKKAAHGVLCAASPVPGRYWRPLAPLLGHMALSEVEFRTSNAVTTAGTYSASSHTRRPLRSGAPDARAVALDVHRRDLQRVLGVARWRSGLARRGPFGVAAAQRPTAGCDGLVALCAGPALRGAAVVARVRARPPGATEARCGTRGRRCARAAPSRRPMPLRPPRSPGSFQRGLGCRRPPTTGCACSWTETRPSAMEEAICGAESSIEALFYIWKADATGQRIRDLLASRARGRDGEGPHRRLRRLGILSTIRARTAGVRCAGRHLSPPPTRAAQPHVQLPQSPQDPRGGRSESLHGRHEHRRRVREPLARRDARDRRPGCDPVARCVLRGLGVRDIGRARTRTSSLRGRRRRERSGRTERAGHSRECSSRSRISRRRPVPRAGVDHDALLRPAVSAAGRSADRSLEGCRHAAADACAPRRVAGVARDPSLPRAADAGRRAPVRVRPARLAWRNAWKRCSRTTSSTLSSCNRRISVRGLPSRLLDSVAHLASPLL